MNDIKRQPYVINSATPLRSMQISPPDLGA